VTSDVWGIGSSPDGSLLVNTVDRPAELVSFQKQGTQPNSCFALLPCRYVPSYFLLPVATWGIRGAVGIFTVPTANTAQSEGLDLIGAESISIQQLTTVALQIRQVTHNAEVQVLARDTADLGVRLERESWCVAECLEHLTQTTRSFVPALSDAIAKAPKLTRNRPLRTGILAASLIRTLNPPYRIRFNVLPQLVPQHTEIETAWTSFAESQSELLDTVRSAAGFAIDKVRIKSPMYARINYNIYGAFRMLVAHQSRHLWQIEQILKALDSRPASSLA
jgi:hypothetical protein